MAAIWEASSMILPSLRRRSPNATRLFDSRLRPVSAGTSARRTGERRPLRDAALGVGREVLVGVLGPIWPARRSGLTDPPAPANRPRAQAATPPKLGLHGCDSSVID